MDWRFLLDENVDPKTARYLEKEDVYVEHVQGALGLGADDTEDNPPVCTRERSHRRDERRE
jgi:predicted nuclease of predicted toxin-antitoxin system